MTPFKIHLHGHLRYQIKLIDQHITILIYTGILGYTVYIPIYYVRLVEQFFIFSFQSKQKC